MEILVKPIVTEKMTKQGETLNQYGFIVDKRATKQQIRRAIKQMYDVTPASVNTMRYSGKSKMRYTKTGVQYGRTNAYKKAIVTLSQGEVIDFFSNI